MSDTAPISKRKPILVRLDEKERTKLEALASVWGVTLAAAIRRLIREKRVPEEP